MDGMGLEAQQNLEGITGNMIWDGLRWAAELFRLLFSFTRLRLYH